jgi:large subunit ribosomal protein L28
LTKHRKRSSPILILTHDMPPFNTPALALPTRRAAVQGLLSSCHSCALFSTSTPLLTKTIKPARLPKTIIPPYPYGERRVYKQSNKGLYGSARIRFGNNVSEKHSVKTQRFWRPNILVKNYFSPSIGANLKTRLTMRVLKTIKREGGIENYLLKSKPARIKELGPGGWNLRWLLMQTKAVQERFNKERIALGLEPKPVEDRSEIIHYALDYATPGGLSLRSRTTQALLATEFTLGNEVLEGEPLEVTDENEEALLSGFEEEVDAEVIPEVNSSKVQAERQRLDI